MSGCEEAGLNNCGNCGKRNRSIVVGTVIRSPKAEVSGIGFCDHWRNEAHEMWMTWDCDWCGEWEAKNG